MIAEPTLEHYIYYLRRVEGDNSKSIQERHAAFEEELRALLVHLEGLSGQPISAWEWPQESEDRRASQLIVRTDWLDDLATRRAYFVAACAYGDIYWLQVSYAQRGQAGPEIFVSLRNEAWQPSAMDHLLGSSSYLCGIATGEVDGLTARALAAYTGDRPGAILSTYLINCCAGLYGSPQSPHVTMILYPDAECEDWIGRTILNDIAPRLELYKHKTDQQLGWCEENFRILSEQEQALRDLLERVGDAPQSNAQLLQRFVRLYRVFNSNAGMLTERQMTLGINLDNLDVVLEELKPLAEDHLLGAVRDHLRRRQAQLEADLAFTDQSRQQAERIINALTAELALEHLVSSQKGPDDAVLIERGGWPGTLPLIESEIEALTLRPKPSQPVTYPRIEVSTRIAKRLTAEDKALLQRVYRGYGRVLVEKEFGGGFGGAQVLRILPITPNGRSSARKVTKIGPATELRRERDNYVKYVEEHLPFCAARVEWARYYEQNGWAGLNYVSVGGGSLGQVVDLEEYYRGVSPDNVGQIVETLGDLLDKELGQNWYDQNDLLRCFFAAEYSQHMVGHLRLNLRLASSDALWLAGQMPAEADSYERIEIEDIPYEYETKKAGQLLSIEGMVIRKIKHGEVKLQDPDSQGTIVRVEFNSASNAVRGLQLGDEVGVRGEVVCNRCDRMEQIVRSVFPDLSSGVGDERIRLPSVTGMHPNPLRIYPNELGRMLEGRKSYVHGDLNLRNVLVDESGKGWLIDFAKVEMRHNLFDFIKLETYIRLMGLGRDEVAFSLSDYTHFEEALVHATLNGADSVTCPDNVHLQVAYQVILAIRHIARKYMGREPDFRNEYLPALFLYCLAVMKYYREDRPQPTRLIFSTACVLGQYLPEIGHRAHPSVPSTRPKPRPPSVESHLATGHRWAVMVGVNAYQNRDISNLTCCVADVEAVHRLLTDAAHGGYRARLLLDTTPDTLPTRNNLLAELANVAQAADEKDLLLFYFSGHGTIEAGEAYLVLSDARLTNLADSAVPLHRVKSIMADSAARAKVIILDACHSGARIGKAEARMSPDFMKRVFAEAEGLAILASCQQGQVSYEWEQAGQSVFTHYLLEGLAGAADFDNKGFVTIQDINRHVADRVKVWAVERGRSQTPTLGGGWSGDIVVCDYPEEQTLL